jgi:hypothetical protein
MVFFQNALIANMAVTDAAAGDVTQIGRIRNVVMFACSVYFVCLSVIATPDDTQYLCSQTHGVQFVEDFVKPWRCSLLAPLVPQK